MLKVNELFSGIGSQNSALKRLAIDYEITTTSDLDTHAIISYAAIHCGLMEKLKDYDFPSGEEMADYLLERNIGWDFKNNKPYSWKRFIDKITGKGKKDLKKAYLATVLSNNAGDISKIDKLDYADFWTYSFPCQDISVAGKQEGIEKHTRSGLLYEVERLLNISAEHGELPKYLMLENVKNLVGKKFKAQFDEWLEYLDELGYSNYWQVLNAKNYGIPQNRERVFVVSIRKDIDTGDFAFPEGFDNGLRLKDFLEDEVDEKFYISQEKVNKIINSAFMQEKTRIQNGDGVCQTLLARDYKDPKCIPIDKSYNNPKPIDYANCITAREDRGISNHQAEGTAILEEKTDSPKRIGNIYGEQFGTGFGGNVWDKEYISPTLTTMQGGGREPMVVTESKPILVKHTEIPCVYDDRDKGFGVKTSDILPAQRAERYGIKVIVKEATKRDHIDSPLNFQNCPDYSGCEFAMICERSNNCIMQEGDGHPKVAVKEATKIGYAEATVGDSINIQFPNSDTRRGRVGKGVAQTLETSCNRAVIDPYNRTLPKDQEAITTLRTNYSNGNAQIMQNYRIRKLTPRECFRLMGFTDEEFQKAQDAGVSNSQLYKQAGNSIVVDVLEYIFGNLLK
jgi:DNA (cytosine-5)-methyltransferase 1